MERNVIYNEDCKITLKRIKDKSIDGIITSPPYNIKTERSDCYYNNGYSELDALSENDIIVEFDAKNFNQESFNIIQNFTNTIFTQIYKTLHSSQTLHNFDTTLHNFTNNFTTPQNCKQIHNNAFTNNKILQHFATQKQLPNDTTLYTTSQNTHTTHTHSAQT
jgi:DNA modification methylase